MIIHHDFNLKKPLNNSVVTLGSFDGVHIGHRKILDKVVEDAKKLNVESVLITFEQHPRKILNKSRSSLSLLTTPQERRQIFSEIGIDHLICLKFNNELASLKPEEFVEKVFVEFLNVTKVITGYGHRFGKDGRGDYTLLANEANKHGFQTEMIPMQDVKNNMVSSTIIRELLHKGDVADANTFLGYNYMLNGVVIKGMDLGKRIGFPTANLTPDHPEKLIPGNGVYAVKAIVKGSEFNGMMNIGVRPTFKRRSRSIEVHIFDFNENIYGEKITISFMQRVRDEIKFDSIDELKQQLSKDKIIVIDILTR